MKRRLDIELALHFMGSEMLKLGEEWGGKGRYAPGFSPSALAGYCGTTFYLSDPIPASPSDPHRDALAINAAVQGLHAIKVDASLSAHDLAPECAGFISAGDPILASLGVNVGALILMHAKMRTQPTWEVEFDVRAVIEANGSPKLVRVGPRPHRGSYGVGDHCPLAIYPDPREVVSDRAEYVCWRDALGQLATSLSGTLDSLEVTGPLASARPWLEAPRKPTILRDLTKDWTPKVVPRRKMLRANAAHA